MRTVLSPSGADISRVENLEFWAQIPIADTRENPTLVFDFGDISENSVAFGPDTAFIRLGRQRAPATPPGAEGRFRAWTRSTASVTPSRAHSTSRATTMACLRRRQNSGDRIRHHTRPAPTQRILPFFKTCRGGYGIRQILGDSRIDCTVANNRLDEEDIDADNA